jgi:hypothetical protein
LPPSSLYFSAMIRVFATAALSQAFNPNDWLVPAEIADQGTEAIRQ